MYRSVPVVHRSTRAVLCSVVHAVHCTVAYRSTMRARTYWVARPPVNLPLALRRTMGHASPATRIVHPYCTPVLYTPSFPSEYRIVWLHHLNCSTNRNVCIASCFVRAYWTAVGTARTSSSSYLAPAPLTHAPRPPPSSAPPPQLLVREPAWKRWLRRLLVLAVNAICAAVYLAGFAGAIIMFIQACSNTSWQLADRSIGAVFSGLAVVTMGAGIMYFCHYWL